MLKLLEERLTIKYSNESLQKIKQKNSNNRDKTIDSLIKLINNSNFEIKNLVAQLVRNALQKYPILSANLNKINDLSSLFIKIKLTNSFTS